MKHKHTSTKALRSDARFRVSVKIQTIMIMLGFGQLMPSSVPEWQHAIVMGASVAGLLAARVLASHFRQVTLLGKDALPVLPHRPMDAENSN